MFVKEKDVKDFWNFSKSEKIFLRKDFDIKKITLRCPNISERIWHNLLQSSQTSND